MSRFTARAAEMRAAVEVAKRVNAKWCTVVPDAIEPKLDLGYQTANVIDNLRACAEICEPAGLALVLEPLRTRLQEFMDAVFFRGQRAYADRIRNFSHELTTALDLDTIGRILRVQIAATLAPAQTHIFTYDSVNDQFVALPAEDFHRELELFLQIGGCDVFDARIQLKFQRRRLRELTRR